METFVVPEALLASVADTVSNVVTTAAVVDGGAVAISTPAPAGSDEASALATANTSLHSANFLAVAALSFADMGMYAGNIGLCDAGYEAVDAANGAQFL